jgi:tRNA threonylcarbamoyladenosine biosynthesis protein TsaB
VRVTVALDTATDIASIAVGSPSGLLAQVVVTGRRHAAATVPAVGDALRLAGVRLDDVAHIVVADGPGSFTGLRIGVATVQGIVRARPRIRVSTAPSLLAAAWVAGRFLLGPIAALYDALRGEVYGAVYGFDGDGVQVLLPPTLGTVEALAEQSERRPTVAVGDGAVRHAETVRAWTGREPIAPPAGASRAAAFLALEAAEGALRPVPDIMEFDPDYGRPAEAQVRWERAHGRRLPDSPGDRG